MSYLTIGTNGTATVPLKDSSIDWQIDGVVRQLREIRADSLSSSARAKRPVKLPQREPSRASWTLMRSHVSQSLGKSSVIRRSVDYFVGYTLDQALDEIVEQVARELNLTSTTPILRSDPAAG